MCDGSINWIGDDYCDDGNNNAACNFDGGDCCDNSTPGWDSYCSVSLQHIYNVNCFCSVCKFFFVFY